MTNAIIQNHPLDIHDQPPIIAAGHAANVAASRHVFADFRQRKAAQTIRRHDAQLALFQSFLHSLTIDVSNLAIEPMNWHGVTWGIIAAFQQWLLQQGYAVASVNVIVSTVKVYAKLAAKAGIIDPATIAQINQVTAYARKEQKHLDETRDLTRIGTKKAHAIVLSLLQVTMLKNQPATTTGRRDALLMCLLLDHGLRCGEVALLRIEHFDQARRTCTFYRPKVDKQQTHLLSDDTRRVLLDYLAATNLTTGLLFQATRKGGIVIGQGMSERAITGRVAYLGKRLGIAGLSAHDCRHTWATLAARAKTPLDDLREAGGWNSLAMPLSYIESAKIANEGIRLE